MLNVQLRYLVIDRINLSFIVPSFKDFFLTILPLPEVTYPLKYAFLRYESLQLVSEPWFKGFGHSCVVSALT